MQRLKDLYQEQVMPALQEELGYENRMEIPRLEKIVVNVGMGEALQNAKALDAAVDDITIITGQRPIVTRARKSIAAFKLREGNPVGVKVTLRGERMWAFLDRLCNVALPRQRDFRGISPDAFDGRGNYSLGLREQLVFPEIDYDKIDKIRGMEITIVTTAQTDAEGYHLLRHLGMPFRGRSGGRA
jgi:large subunit ribosomal protein L5